MNRAIELASENVLNGGGPFGAVIVDANFNIVAEGANSVTRTNDCTNHAEMVCIRNACKNLNSFKLTDCTLYTSCEPCSMCFSAAVWGSIKKIYYGNTKTDAKNIGFDDEFIYEEIKKDPIERSVQMKQICRNISIESFELWNKKEDKIEY